MNEYTKSEAVFSSDKVYRYTLERWWSPFTQGRYANFLMLNPSTADAVQPDPTVTRAIGFARQWGFGGLVVTNIFAYRSTDPQNLRKVDDPIGHRNDGHILAMAVGAGLVVGAWGVHGEYMDRGRRVAGMLRSCGIKLHCLGTTKAGHPRHPLYLKGTSVPELYTV